MKKQTQPPVISLADEVYYVHLNKTRINRPLPKASNPDPLAITIDLMAIYKQLNQPK